MKTRTIEEVNALIAELCEELDNLDRPKSQLLISDDDDDYQENLELSWHRDELQERLENLEAERISLWNAERKLNNLDKIEEETNYVVECHNNTNIIFNNKNQAIEAIFIKSYPHGKLFFAQERIALTDYDNIIINSLDIIPFLEESNAIKYQEMKDENDLNAFENQTNN